MPEPPQLFDPALAADNSARALLRAALRLRCVVCKQGPVHPTWRRCAEACPSCGISVCREQGFFLGSIYINYGMTAAVVIVIWFGSGAAFRPLDPCVLLPLIGFSLLFPPWFLRYARALWAALDQYFDPRSAAC